MQTIIIIIQSSINPVQLRNELNQQLAQLSDWFIKNSQ